MDRRNKMEKDKEQEKGTIDPDDVLRRMLNTPPPKKEKGGKKKKPAK